ncbi:Mss4-like protein [Mycena polygramma]|nr:Mss4-like protein [Mycena polygramma]
MSDSPQLIEYRGNCHCGAFRFTFKSPKLTQAKACNCSICSKHGYLWTFPDNLNITKGEENSTLKSYEFAGRKMTHKFCPNCGTSVMARSVDGQVGINMRALADVDLWSLSISSIDGAKTQPPYEVPEPIPSGIVPEGTTLYHGSCHCGAIGYTLQVVAPETLTRANDCNCSICSRNGALWEYSDAKDVTFKGLDSLSQYTFASGKIQHGFCSICGVSIRFVEDTEGMPLNLRTLNGFDLSPLEIEQSDNKSRPPVYEL